MDFRSPERGGVGFSLMQLRQEEDLAGDEDKSKYVIELTNKAIEEAKKATNQCFMCGGKPTNGKGEHIFPVWLQRRYNLWDQKLTLLNGTQIPYRNLRVPACEHCNGSFLGKTEDFVSRLSGDDVGSWSEEFSFEVGRWLAKILVCILIKESNLILDRKNQHSGTIYPKNALDELFLLHLLVQSFRKKVSFECIHTVHPFTLYVYEIADSKHSELFNFSTNLIGKSVCIRFGNIGFAFAGDGGLQHHISMLGPHDLGFQKLHPIQFDELAARVHYKSFLRNATHLYLHNETPELLEFRQLEVSPYTSEKLADGSSKVFHEWSDKDLAPGFELYGVPGWRDLLNDAGDVAYTWLVDEEGVKLEIDD